MRFLFELWKFPEITPLWSSFLQNQGLTCSLENNPSKQAFLENLREDPEKVFKKDSAIDALLGGFQKFQEQLLYQSIKGQFKQRLQNLNRRFWVNK